MKNLKIIFPFVLILLMFSACTKNGCDSSSQKAVFKNIQFLDCGWMIAVNGGENQFLVTNLADFTITPEEGKEIWVSYHEVSIGRCVEGSAVEIDCISER